MRRSPWLLAALVLLLAGPLAAQPPAVLVRLELAVHLGERRMVAQPQLRLASEQEAIVQLVDEEQTQLQLSVTPKVEGDRIRLAVVVSAVHGALRLQRTHQFTAFSGESAQFFDEDSERTLKLAITATLTE